MLARSRVSGGGKTKVGRSGLSEGKGSEGKFSRGRCSRGRCSKGRGGLSGISRGPGFCVDGGKAVLGRVTGCGADDILRLFRRSSSACKVLTGDEERANGCFGFGFSVVGSNRAIAFETGTLLSVV